MHLEVYIEVNIALRVGVGVEVEVGVGVGFPIGVGVGVERCVWRVYSIRAWPWSYDHRPWHPYYAGTEQVGLSPTRQALLAPSAERREVFGESHEG